MSMAAHKKLIVSKILPEELKIGMYVSELDRPWLETPFLFQGFRIESEQEIDAIRDLCDFVFIDVVKSDCIPANSQSVPLSPRKRKRYKIERPAEQEISAAYNDYQGSLKAVDRLLLEIQDYQTFDSKPIRHHVTRCASSIVRNPAALMWLSRIKHVDSYTAEHSLNVGILAMSVGRHLGYDREDLETLGLCGILHDVGKMHIDPEILNKPGRLTPEEMEHIRHHPDLSIKILSQDESLGKTVLEAAHSHHERFDGLGYPGGVNASQLNEFTKIVTIVDAFDAMTSERCYSDAKPISEALKVLYENRNEQFDDDLVIRFIECIGVYPPGSIVEMISGEVGFVINNTKHRVLPRVALMLDKDKQPMMQHIVDLSAQSEAGENERMHIRKVLPDGSHDLTLEEFTRQNIRIMEPDNPSD